DIENQGLIPEPIRETVFDKFVTYGKPQGTGIGTYSAMLTAQLHGGSIHFSLSEKAGTTTISVCLPQPGN
ncbi:MAG: ATP-binding protein, partial [Desulfobacterales bacterium]|nr:ATP-binding protein [Desulfobacterales bacterium]